MSGIFLQQVKLCHYLARVLHTEMSKNSVDSEKCEMKEGKSKVNMSKQGANCFVSEQTASMRNVDPSEKHYIRATSSSILSGTSKATCFCRVYNALVGQTLNCTLFTQPTWTWISCRCGYLNHNELIMVLLVQDCCSFLPLHAKMELICPGGVVARQYRSLHEACTVECFVARKQPLDSCNASHRNFM